MAFLRVAQENPGYPAFILVFHKTDLPSSRTWSLRTALLSDELGSKDEKQFREQQVNVLSTWTYHHESRSATFWLREDEMQRMKDEGWRVCVFRTDTWRSQSGSYGVDKVEDLGVRWVDQVNGRA
jgi:glutathione synthase/RimK-type ligase-like ATP-grasp enzyme